ncbi:MAG: DsbA family protein [Bacteroides sp.]|nr:DsbA family protein [Bacteroides sp.]
MKAEKVILTSFTDPLCTWCWGMEPTMRKLETHFGSQIEIRYVMGGMVKDINEIASQNQKDIDSINKEIEEHWIEATSRHGMPVKGFGFSLFSKEKPSTYPQNIAYKAALLTDSSKARRFLHRLREASAADYLITSDKTVLEQIARESGLDTCTFLRYYTDDTAEKEFRKDLEYTAKMEVGGFPTTFISYESREEVIFGYSSYDRYVRAIERVSARKVRPSAGNFVTDESKLQFISELGSMALAEIREAFDYNSDKDTEEWIMKMEQLNRLNIRKAGNSYIVTTYDSPQLCDMSTGKCL